MELKGRVAVVTGASRETGAAVARRLGAMGASVAVHYHSAKDQADAVADEVRALGGQAAVFQADLRKYQQAEKLISEAGDSLGPVDILVCNVGGYLMRPFVETSYEDWREQFRMNLDTAFGCVSAVLPGMIERKFGRIVTLSAAGALLPGRQKDHVAWTSAKAALLAFTRALALEVAADGVTVNNVAPGIVSATATREDARARGNFDPSPVGRIGSGEDIADAVAYLVRPENDFVTGTMIEVAGGWRL